MPQTDAPAWEDTEAIPTWDETRPLLSDAEMGQMAAKPPMQFLPGGMNEPGAREEKLQEAGAILGGAITAPGRAIDAVMPRWASEPLVNPQTAPSDLAFRKSHPVIGGVESAVVNLAKSFTSPIGIATLGMGALPGAAQRAVSLAFAGQMASSFPQLTDQIVQTYQQPDSPERTQELTRLFTEAAGTGAFTALATKHGLTPSEPILNRDQAMANRIAVRLSMPERLTISPQEQARLGLAVPEAAPPRFEDTSPIPEGGEMPQTPAVQFPMPENVNEGFPIGWDKIQGTGTSRPVRQEIKSLQDKWKSQGVLLHITNNEGQLQLGQISVLGKKGEGLGSRAITDVNSLADDLGLRVTLTAMADTGKQADLERFYLRHGYEQVATDPLNGKPIFAREPKPKESNAGSIEPTTQVGLRGEGQEVGGGAPLRQQGAAANLPPQEGTVGRGGAGQAPEEKAPDLSKSASNVEKGIQVEAQDHPKVAATNPELLRTLAEDELKLDPEAYKGDEVKSVKPPPENRVKTGETEGGGAGKVGGVETLKANERTTTEPTGPNQQTAAGTQSSQQLADSLRENVPLGEGARLGDLRNAVQSYKSSPETSQLPQVLARYSLKAPWEITKREAINLGESVPELKKIRNLAAAKAFQDKSDSAYKAAEKAFNQAREIAIEKLGIKGQNYNQGRGLDSQQLAERLSQKQSENYHRQVIEDALKKGKHVPQEVIADYPDLAKKYGLSTTPPATSAGVETKQPTITEHASRIRALDDGSLLDADGNTIKPGEGIKLSFMGGPSDMPTPWTLVKAENYPSTVNYKLNPRVTVRAANGVERTYDTANVYSPRKITLPQSSSQSPRSGTAAGAIKPSSLVEQEAGSPQPSPVKEPSVTITKNDAQEIIHKLSILEDETDLQADYGLTQSQASELVKSVPPNGGEWSIPQWAKKAVSGELADHARVLRDIANDARGENKFGQALAIDKQAKKFEQLSKGELKSKPGGGLSTRTAEERAKSAANNSLKAMAEANGVTFVEGDTPESLMAKINAKGATVAKSATVERPLKIGDEQTIMQVPSVLADTKTIGGVKWDLFNGVKLKEDRAAVRVIDVESGEVLQLKQFPNYDAAEAYYKSETAKAQKLEEPPPSPAGAGEKEIPTRASDKSVRDLPVRGSRKGDAITISPKYGPKLTFSAKELSGMTEFDRMQMLEKKTRAWDDEPGGFGQAARLRDSVRKVLGILSPSKPSLQDRIDAAKRAQAKPTPPPSEPPSGGAVAKPIGMGGAVPSEFAQSPQTPTSIKNAQVDIERAKRGLPPAIQPARKSFGAVWDEAMAKIDQDPGFQDRLLSELRDKPRALTDLEDALLLHRQIDLQNEYGKATRDLAQAYEDGRVDDVISEKARVQALSDALYDIYQIGKRVGTETGRGLNARRMMAFEDFTLAKMELEKRAIKDGAPLTESERAEVQRLHDKIAATQKAYDDYVAATEKRDAERAIQDALREVEQKAKAEVEPHIRIIADKIKTYFDNRADAALKRLSGKLFTLSPQVLADLTDLGVSRILGGAARLPEWSVKMVEALGERIRPHLQTIWESSNRALDEHIQKVAGTGAEKVKRVVKGTDTAEKKTATTEAISEKVNSGQRNDITGLVQKLARLFVQEGIRNREELIDAVHGVLKGIDPEFTRRETMDAISGYGQFKQLSKDEISVRLRGMKGEMQQIAKLEDMAKGVPPSKTGLERRTPTDEERRLIKAVNEAKIQFQVPITDPLTQLKSALDTRKSQLENARKDYERRLVEKDFEKKPKRIIQFDAEANRLHFEAMKAKTAWHEAMMKDRLAKRSIPAKIFGGALEAMNTARAVMTSADLSAVLRQGGFIAFAHPVRALKSFPAMFSAFRSEAGQHAVNQEILARKNYPLYQQSKLYLSEHGHKLSQMEEAYMTRWADKIPLVAGSQRAYVTFLNKLRADSFDAMANSLAREKELTSNEANAISNFINVATGRGNLGMKENALVGLNSIFFAPRYVASRFQLLAGQPFYRGSARTRTLMAQEYGRFLIGVAIVYGLAKMDGAQIETDPRSADFGKLRYGNTRVDPLAGLLQTTVLLSRLSSGETKTAGGHIVPIRGDKVPYGGADSAEVIGRFLRSKLSPALGTGLNVLTGKDVVGQPVTASAIAQNLLIPLAWQDIYKTMREQGVDHGTAMAILSIFGMGLQNYDEKKKAPQPFKLPVIPKAPHLPVLPYYHTPQPSTNSMTR